MTAPADTNPLREALAMADKITCCNCDQDCTRHHWMCDEPDQDGAWCPDCWEQTACCAGVHGEGCPTQVFSASREGDEL